MRWPAEPTHAAAYDVQLPHYVQPAQPGPAQPRKGRQSGHCCSCSCCTCCCCPAQEGHGRATRPLQSNLSLAQHPLDSCIPAALVANRVSATHQPAAHTHTAHYGTSGRPTRRIPVSYNQDLDPAPPAIPQRIDAIGKTRPPPPGRVRTAVASPDAAHPASSSSRCRVKGKAPLRPSSPLRTACLPAAASFGLRE